MKPSALLLVAALAATGWARADVEVEDTCWVHTSPGKSDRATKFVLRTYRDTALGKEIGAVVQYAGSRETIPVVFTQFVETDPDEPGLGNYELTRVEVLNGRVSGEYVFFQTGAGIRQGRGVAYRKSKTSKPVLFQYTSSEYGTCALQPARQ
jgi:hypothetical protein